jgi:hypothetical protein
MATDPLGRAPARAPLSSVLAAADQGPDPLNDTEHPRDLDTPNASEPELEDVAEGPQAAPQTADEAARSSLITQATAVLDNATAAIVDNITRLIERAERLKANIINDNAESKRRIQMNLEYGGRALQIAQRMDSELDELEQSHADALKNGGLS